MQQDIFFEQLYTRKKGVKEYVLQALIIIVTILLSVAVFMFLMSLQLMFSLMLATFAIMGILYVGYKQFLKFNIEYEYIYLNGEMDIDRIISRSDRSRIVTMKVEDISRFGEYNEAAERSIQSVGVAKRFDFRSNTDKPLYYAVFKHKTMGQTAIIFEPDERILGDIKKRIRF